MAPFPAPATPTCTPAKRSLVRLGDDRPATVPLCARATRLRSASQSNARQRSGPPFPIERLQCCHLNSLCHMGERSAIALSAFLRAAQELEVRRLRGRAIHALRRLVEVRWAWPRRCP